MVTSKRPGPAVVEETLEERTFPTAKEMQGILKDYRLDKETVRGLQQTAAEFMRVAEGHKPRTGNFCAIFMGTFGSRRRCNGTTKTSCCHPDRFTAAD